MAKKSKRNPDNELDLHEELHDFLMEKGIGRIHAPMWINEHTNERYTAVTFKAESTEHAKEIIEKQMAKTGNKVLFYTYTGFKSVDPFTEKPNFVRNLRIALPS